MDPRAFVKRITKITTDLKQLRDDVVGDKEEEMLGQYDKDVEFILNLIKDASEQTGKIQQKELMNILANTKKRGGPWKWGHNKTLELLLLMENFELMDVVYEGGGKFYKHKSKDIDQVVSEFEKEVE